jgi:NDP-sugar pyrophosphorylase family protein
MKLAEDGRIVSLGVADPPADEIDGRYVGLLKFTRQSLDDVAGIYEQMSKSHWDKPWQQSGKPFKQAYMTDLLQELIDRGKSVFAVKVRGGWLEFDTNEDYETQRDWAWPVR